MQHGPTDAELKRETEHKTTQTTHPWRATVRTMIAASIAAIPIGQVIARETELDTVPWIASFLALGTVVSRVMAMQATETFLRTYAPWLAASAYRGQHRKSDRYEPYPIDDHLD